VAEEVQQQFGLATARSEMDIRNEDASIVRLRYLVVHISLRRASKEHGR
jgi:hypothetical protein